MKYIVLWDYSCMYHLSMRAAMRAGPDYNLEQATIVNAQGKLRTIHRKLEESGIAEYELIFVEDRVPVRKLELFPQYKPGRSDLSVEKDKLKQHLRQNGREARFCHADGEEADDCLASLTKLALRAEDTVVALITCDADLWQLLGPRTLVLNPVSREFVTAADVHKSYGVPPSHLALYKALWGDSGDGIPNVLPRQQRQLLPFILGIPSGDFNEFEVMVKEQMWIFSARCQELLAAGLEQCRINWSLVKLDDRCELVWD